MIARTGPEAFRAHGVVEDPGTSLVTVSGAVEHAGVVEVDRGTPLADIVARATPNGPIRALLVGGYGGSWVGPADFPTPYASMSLRTVGATAGVGIVVVLGADACGIAESARVARLPGRAERRPVWSLRLRPARHRRRHGAPGPGTGRRRLWSSVWDAAWPRSTAGEPAGTPTAP